MIIRNVGKGDPVIFDEDTINQVVQEIDTSVLIIVLLAAVAVGLWLSI